MMEYSEMMRQVPKELQPTIVSNNEGYQKALESRAKELDKKVENLTEEEKEDVRATYMAAHGLCDLDLMIP